MAAAPLTVTRPDGRRSGAAMAAFAVTVVVALVTGLLGIRPAAAIVLDVFSVQDVTQAEGTAASGSTAFTFTVKRESGTGPATVDYAASNGTATTPSDYASASGTLSFATNDTQKTVTVNVVPDSTDEPNETFNFTLTPGATGSCQNSDCVAIGTIVNDDGPDIFVDNAAPVAEGDPTTTPPNQASFGVHLSATSTHTVTVQYTATSGTATAGTDFAATTGTLTFDPGQKDKTVTVDITGDTTDEDDETFTLVLSNPTGGSLTGPFADPSGDATITDDDAPPVASVPATFSSGEQTATAAVPVHLSATSGKTVTVTYSTADGTAVAPADYTAVANGTVTFAPGQQDATAPVTVINDTADEADETFTVTIAGSSTASVDPSSASTTVTITDNDPAPKISIGDAAPEPEGNPDGAAHEAVFTVSLSNPSGSTVTVHYTTTPNSAVAGSDYTTTSGTLTFVPGDPAQAIRVPITADLTNEATETFFVDLSAPTGGAELDTARGTGTITDDDPEPTLSIAGASGAEGNTGPTPFSFDVTLSAASGQTVTVNYATSDNTATTADADYASASGTLTFAPGDLKKTITVNVTGDTKHEPDETFRVDLSTANHASIVTGQATGTITNDDTPPAASINDVQVTEGSSGSSQAKFTVTLAGSSSQTITIAYTTVNGTATAPSDYTTTSGSLVFNPGDTTKDIFVPVNGDTTPESDETFTVHLSDPTPSGAATLAKADGTGTIKTDDAPTLTINDVSHNEGNAGTTTYDFTVTRAGNVSGTSTVDWTTADDTATVTDGDYVAGSGTLTFAATETTKHILVSVNGDSAFEGNETFKVLLSNPGVAAVTDGEGIGTITNDDVTISISDVSGNEGSSGTSDLTLHVTLSGPSTSTITVAASTANGTATVADGDYNAFVNQIVTFAPGDVSEDVLVTVKGDTKTEPNETVLVNLSSASAGASILDPQGVATITNDDSSVATIDDVTVTEGDVPATFTVTLSNPSSSTVTVAYATSNGTATAGSDYTATSGTATFAAGETTKPIAVTVKGDSLDEDSETFVVTLSAPTGASIGDGTGVGTITDDDSAPAVSIADGSTTEGNAATVSVTFTVTLAPVSGRTVTVGYSTANGTATAGSDYTATSGTLTFAAGETSKTITVQVPGDTADEPNETFTVTLASATNATISRATATGTINDDDEPAAAGGGATPQGYSLVGEDGALYAFGTAKNLGDMRGTKLNAPIIGVQYTPGGNGYWLVAKDGGIFTFGDAEFHGSTGDLKLVAPVIGMAATPSGKGYWLFASDGGIFAFGDAEFFGSMGGQKLNAPVINMEPLASGRGYWLVAADGGIFTFGLGDFYGSMGDQKINQPVFDMTSTDSDHGYWLVARDGGIFSFGDAGPKFFGSAVNEANAPTKVIGMDATPDNQGYWIADASGRIYRYGDAQALGDRAGANNPAPMVAFAAVPSLKTGV